MSKHRPSASNLGLNNSEALRTAASFGGLKSDFIPRSRLERRVLKALQRKGVHNG